MKMWDGVQANKQVEVRNNMLALPDVTPAHARLLDDPSSQSGITRILRYLSGLFTDQGKFASLVACVFRQCVYDRAAALHLFIDRESAIGRMEFLVFRKKENASGDYLVEISSDPEAPLYGWGLHSLQRAEQWQYELPTRSQLQRIKVNSDWWWSQMYPIPLDIAEYLTQCLLSESSQSNGLIKFKHNGRFEVAEVMAVSDTDLRVYFGLEAARDDIRK